MRKIWITALLLSATPTTAWAQQAQSAEENRVAATDEALAPAPTDIVVTASGQGQRLIDVPASVSVITAEQLTVRPVRDLTDILDRSEGVTLNRAGNQRTIQIRGLPSNYTLFLIDGKRVNAGNAAFRGNNFDSNWVPVEAIARVEVVRGPLSSLYGTDAIGGVVNVITKPVGEAWHGSFAADSTVQQDHASGNYDKLGGYVSGPLLPGTLGIKLYGGHNLREADAPTRNAAGAALAGFDRVEETFADGTLVWTPDRRNSVSLNYGYNRLLHGDTPLTRGSAALTYEGAFDWGNGQLRAYGNRIRNLAGNVSGRIQPNRAGDGQVDGRLTVPAAVLRQTFTIGGEYRDQALYDPAHLTGMPGVPGGSTRPSTRVSQWALFGEDEVRIVDRLRLTMGDRYDRHEHFGGRHSPRAYLVWHPVDRVTLKGGWARAFRAPTLLQNAPNWGSVSCGSATTGCYIIGSTALRPETSTSYEASARFDGTGMSAGITLFRNDLRNQISIVNRTRDPQLARAYPNFVGILPDGRPIFRYENLARVRTQGIESSLRADVTRRLEVTANYSYLDAVNRSSDPALPVAYTPEHSANLSANWQVGDALGWFTTANYVGRQYLNVSSNPRYTVARDGYATVDTSVSYRFPRLTLRAGLLNLFDVRQDRLTSIDYNEDGRRAFVSAAARF
jgi:outer membrane receptor for ferrienterochelin and colicins